MSYTDINSKMFDEWCAGGWEWGLPVSHEVIERAQRGDWGVLLTPSKVVPREWFGELRDKKLLGLASGGGQQMPVFSVLGAQCTVFDYSQKQLDSERVVAQREGYDIKIVRGDMTKTLPFEDGSFDIIFHPVSNSYVEDVFHVWRECYRVLKKGGIILAGVENGLNFAFDDEEKDLTYKLPFNPLKDRELYDKCIANDWGVQFSHTIEEQIGGQLRAGFVLEDIYGDTNNVGRMRDFNVPSFFATKSKKL